MSHQNELEPWRQGIRDIDAKILELLAERMQLAQKIGSYKQKHNLPVKDFRVEKQIIEKSRDQAAQLGLYPSLVATNQRQDLRHAGAFVFNAAGATLSSPFRIVGGVLAP